MEIWTFTGKEAIAIWKQSFLVGKDQSTEVYRLSVDELLKGRNRADCFAVLKAETKTGMRV